MMQLNHARFLMLQFLARICFFLSSTKRKSCYNGDVMNSYNQVFGAPQGDVYEEDAEMASALFCTFDVHASREKNVESMYEALTSNHKASFDAINENGKAHILQLCFHNANENFWELEDEGIIDDCHEAQEEFLACVVEVLKLR